MDVEQVILFGSHAKGLQNGDSDVGLLVVLHSSKRPAEIRYEIYTLLRDFPLAVDVIIRTPQQIQTANRRRDWFTLDALSQGLLLHGKSAEAH